METPQPERVVDATPAGQSASAASAPRRSRFVSAATLTYRTAPLPSPGALDGIFEMVTIDHASRLARERRAAQQRSYLGGLLASGWQRAQGVYQSHLVAVRQQEFIEHFAPQLEASARDTSVVIASALCVLLSLGQPNCGTLYLTNSGIFFASDGVDDYEVKETATERAADEGLRRQFSASSGGEDDAMSASTSSFPALARSDESPALADGREMIKEHVDFTNVAAIVPSVALEQEIPRRRPRPARRSAGGELPQSAVAPEQSAGGVFSSLRRLLPGSAAAARRADTDTDDDDEPERAPTRYPFIMGVPSLMVAPDCVQVFAARPRQIFQFLHLRDVVIAPPETMGLYYGAGRTPPPGSNASGRAAVPGESADAQRARNSSVAHVLRQAEYEACGALPASLLTLAFATILTRLWEHRLLWDLKLPSLQHADVTYASPH